jgi:hypothetical protein
MAGFKDISGVRVGTLPVPPFRNLEWRVEEDDLRPRAMASGEFQELLPGRYCQAGAIDNHVPPKGEAKLHELPEKHHRLGPAGNNVISDQSGALVQRDDMRPGEAEGVGTLTGAGHATEDDEAWPSIHRSVTSDRAQKDEHDEDKEKEKEKGHRFLPRKRKAPAGRLGRSIVETNGGCP